MLRTNRLAVRLALLSLGAPLLCPAAAHALVDGGTLRLDTFNGWKAFELITQGDDPAGDGFAYAMPSTFDGLGVWRVDPFTLRVQVNHEKTDASISEVDVDLAALQSAVANMISGGSTGGVSFVQSARQAYARWSADGGAHWTATSSAANTDFYRFCSSQSHAPHSFGTDRGFVDELYITGEEGDDGRLFVLDSVNRDLYQLSGVVGSAPGGNGGMPFDRFENAALLDTGETGHVALLLSPDGGTQSLQLYIGEKGKDSAGAASSSFLARNGLAYGSWYFLHGAFPSLGDTHVGGFDSTLAGALSSDKLEDVDTDPNDPTQAVLGDQTSGVFTLDFELVFGAGFDAGASSFTVTKVADTSGGVNSLNGPDNVDWTAATTLGGTPYPDGLIFVNEDTDEGEIWRMLPDGSARIRVASTTTGAESSGILDISALLGYLPGSVLLTNNQGTPASMSVLIHPDASLESALWSDEGCALAGVNGDPLLVGSGPLTDGSANSVTLGNAKPLSPAAVFLALASTPVPFKGGTLKPFPLAALKFVPTSAGGGRVLAFALPVGVPAGTELWVQWAVQDGAAVSGVALSNAVVGVVP